MRKYLSFPKVYLLSIWWNWENLSGIRKEVLQKFWLNRLTWKIIKFNQQRNDTRDWRKSFYRGWFSVTSIAVTSISSLEDTSEVKVVFSIRSSSYLCTCMFVMLQQLSFNIYSISNSQIYWHYINTAFYHSSP